MYQTHTAAKNTPPEPGVAATHYAKALRVVGQDLSSLFPRLLEVETDGVNFAARGESHPNPFEAVKESIFTKIWHWLGNKKTAPKPAEPQTQPVNFSRTFGPDEIDRIE